MATINLDGNETVLYGPGFQTTVLSPGLGTAQRPIAVVTDPAIGDILVYDAAGAFVNEPAANVSSRVFNVRSYGALGDGSSNDSAAIAAAVAAAIAAGGGIVYLPVGTYALGSSLSIAQNNVHLLGDGRGVTVLRLANNVNASVVNVTGNRCSVRSLKIDGNRANQSDGHGLRISGVEHVVSDVWITDSHSYGIGVGQQDASVVQHCRFDSVRVANSGADGIDIKNKADANRANSLTNISVETFDLRGITGQAGIDCRGPAYLSNVEVRGASAGGGGSVRFREDNTPGNGIGGRYGALTNAFLVGDGSTQSYGVIVSNADVSVSNVAMVDVWRGVDCNANGVRAALSNVVVHDAFDRGFNVSADDNVVLTACRAIDCVDGFRIDGDDVSLVGCVSQGSTSDGFDLRGARDAMIGCRIQGAVATNGLVVNAAATDARVIHCDFSQHAGTAVSDSGTGTVFFGSGAATTDQIAGPLVVNEAGADVDVRIEGDTATNLLLIDAGLDAVQIGTTSAGVIAHFASGGIVLNEDGADVDVRIEGDTATQLFVCDAGLDAVRIGTTAAGALGHFRTAGIVLNDAGLDTDIRLEGDTDQNLLFTDASTDRVGIGTNAPNSKLDVTGTVQADGLRLDLAPTAETPAMTHTITISVNGTNYKIPIVAA